MWTGTSKHPYRTPLLRILPRFFGKNPQNTTSIPAVFAYASRQTSQQIRIAWMFRGTGYEHLVITCIALL
jgi:hypothetical protein